MPVLMSVLLGLCSFDVHAQSTEAKQLLLNVEKLSQLKNILRDMKKGYEVLSTGYNTVRNISKGNFSLHEFFLDGLMLVSPEVRKYHKVADMIALQVKIVSEYKAAYRAFSASGSFSIEELDYLGRVYGQLLEQSLDNLDELATVLTAGQLRMADEGRLRMIDRLFADTEDKLLFLRSFNVQTGQVYRARQKEKVNVAGLKVLYQ
ncbi:TerB family tellurite resistance protein [Pedobacter sp. ISL-68]|nr:TerB family tellurite resistance protein [Pedobacter sp. ISL-64]MBT2589667.1 TerB family tellurite resistance protein [Pedobacter sp. ISL-68]